LNSGFSQQNFKSATSNVPMKGLDLSKLEDHPLPPQIMIGNINGNLSINLNSTTMPHTQISQLAQQALASQQQDPNTLTT